MIFRSKSIPQNFPSFSHSLPSIHKLPFDITFKKPLPLFSNNLFPYFESPADFIFIIYIFEFSMAQTFISIYLLEVLED